MSRRSFPMAAWLLLAATIPRGSSLRNPPRPNQEIDVDLSNLSIDEIVRQISVENVCCVDLTRYFLRRVTDYNELLDAAITVDHAGALRDAEILDDYYRRTDGRLKGKLRCVPTFVKDNIFVKGLPTTLGIRLFANATADEDAPVVAKLKKEGAIVLGKANMIMFAAGPTDTGSETGGLAKNPYALDYTVVGSSTGNAVILAARLAVIGVGSDSGGSITAPSSATSVVGLRPATGSVDMTGVYPLLGQPFDTVGPMALNVRDVITVMDIIREDQPEPPGDPQNRAAIRIGILQSLTYGSVNVTSPLLDPSGYFITTTYTVDSEIQECFRRFQTRLDSLSEKYRIVSSVIKEDIVEMARPVLENENHRWSCIVSDMSRFLARRPMRSCTGELIDNADRIIQHPSTPAYYRSLLGYLSKRVDSCAASRQRYGRYLTIVRRRLQRKVFDRVDVIVMPTLNALPWLVSNSRHDSFSEDDEGSSYSSSSPHANGHLHDLGGLFALPALNLPLCFSGSRPGASQGLPIGGYLMTVPDRVDTMLEFGRLYETEFADSRLPRVVASYL